MNELYGYDKLMSEIGYLVEKYPILTLSGIGYSVMGKPLPALKIGQGKSKLLYVGTHHGLESITSALLIRFTAELCKCLEEDTPIYGISPRFIYEARSIYIIPMLNPDSVELRRQSNANGVDLNHNYDAGFNEYKEIEKSLGIKGPAPTRYSGRHPESEPETKAICSFIRDHAPFKYLFTFHSQGEEIYSGWMGHQPKNSLRTAKALAGYSGYALAEPEGAAGYGGLKDWYVKEFDLPAYTIECGKGENPLPLSQLDDVYNRLRRMLFRTPIM